MDLNCRWIRSHSKLISSRLKEFFPFGYSNGARDFSELEDPILNILNGALE